MTEVADANLEDVEFLKTKFRELKIQAREELETLRHDRDQMREYKRIRDDHNKEVKALIESVKAEREERDRINQEINEAKERRMAIHAQLRSVYDEIRELRSNLVGSPSNDQRKMMRRVEELEWRQQTEQLTRDEEVAIVEEIARIETQLVKIGQEKEKQDRISELRRLARKLKDEASEAHEKVLSLSEQSQVHHQEVVRIRPQLEEYKKAADTAHKNFVEWLKKVKEGETKLKERRAMIDDIQTKLRKQTVEKRDLEREEQIQQQRAQERERVESAVEKLQSGKRLTFDEFILAQRTFGDDRKKSRKRGRSESEEIKVEPEPVESVESEETMIEPEPEESHESEKTKVEPEPEESIESDTSSDNESESVEIDEELEEITAAPPEESKDD